MGLTRGRTKKSTRRRSDGELPVSGRLHALPVRCSARVGPVRTRGLDHFDTVAERVAELEPLVTGDRYGVDDLHPGRRQARPPRRRVADGVRHVRLGRAPLDALLGADVHLAVADLEPE